MTPENTQLPTARMATVNATSFWIYWIACLFLYTFNHFSSSPYLVGGFINPVGGYVIIAIFLTLFLYIAGQRVKSAENFKQFNLFCYIFQSASLLFLIYKVFF